MTSYIELINDISIQIENEIAKEKLSANVLEFSKHSYVCLFTTSSNAQLELKERTRDSIEENEILQHGAVAVQKLRDSEIHFYRELYSYYKPIRAVVVFAKRVLRKLARFIIEPIVGECNQIRLCAADAFDNIQVYLLDQEHLVKEELYNLQSKIVRLQQKVDTLEHQIQEMKTEEIFYDDNTTH